MLRCLFATLVISLMVLGCSDKDKQPPSSTDQTKTPPSGGPAPAVPPPGPSYAWVSGEDRKFPADAISGGHEAPPESEELYVCRSQFGNGVHPGKFRAGFGGCNIGWGGTEHTVPVYDLLTGHATWVPAASGQVPPRAIQGGVEAAPESQRLYVCRANYQNGIHAGKLRPEFGGCNLGWGGKEVTVPTYEVLTAG